MASFASNVTESLQPSETVAQRRLRAEWALLEQLVALNPTRLAAPRRSDSTFEVDLLATPALTSHSQAVRAEHHLRIVYPRFFPAVPLELYLAEADPVMHLNIHPLTGFVCLWDQHRVANTIEHALHKTVAILGWQLLNPDPRHVMQPAALTLGRKLIAARLGSHPLTGIEHSVEAFPQAAPSRRRRLS